MDDNAVTGVEIRFNRDGHVVGAGAGTDNAGEAAEVGEVDVPEPRDIVAVVDVIIDNEEELVLATGVVAAESVEDDIAAGGVLTEVEGDISAGDVESLVAAVGATVARENVLGDPWGDVVKLGAGEDSDSHKNPAP